MIGQSVAVRSRLRKEATQILGNNDRRTFIAPGPHQYPGQWNWDSALVAIGLAVHNPARARAEIEYLLEGQWEDGLVPHIVFREPKVDYFPGPEVWRSRSLSGAPAVNVTGITQPPVLASAVLRVNKRDPDHHFLANIVPAIARWHRWLHQNRAGKWGLISILHPWESGTDNSTRFDEALSRIDTSDVGDFERRDTRHVSADQRPSQDDYRRYMALVEWLRERDYRPRSDQLSKFAYIDVGFNAILAAAEDDLALLGDEIGKPQPAARERAAQLRQGIDRAWNEAAGGFLDFDLRSGSSVARSIDSVTSLLPLYAGEVENARASRLVDALWDPDRFGPSDDFPVALSSVAKRSQHFDPRRYWRGPVWVNMNWLLIKGLERCGLSDDAERLTTLTLNLVTRNGMFEYYDPRTGEGLGSPKFSWTASLVLDLLEES